MMIIIIIDAVVNCYHLHHSTEKIIETHSLYSFQDTCMPLSSSIRFRSKAFSSYAGQSIMSLVLSALRSANVHGTPNSRLMRFTDKTICITAKHNHNNHATFKYTI